VRQHKLTTILQDDDDREVKTIDIDEDCAIVRCDAVRDLGVLLDCGPRMTDYISSIVKAYSKNPISEEMPKRTLSIGILEALVISRLDYCNSILPGLPSSTLQPTHRRN